MSGDATVEANLQRTRRWYQEVWNEGREDTIHALMAPSIDFRSVDGTKLTTRDGYLGMYIAVQDAFSGIVLELEELVGDGDRVAVRGSGTACHTGPLFGIPATGRTVRMDGLLWLEWRNGQIVAGGQQIDWLGFLVQIGRPPDPPPVAGDQ